MREISKNFLVIPDFKGKTKEIEQILDGKTKYGKIEVVILLDPMAFHQVKTIYLK